MTGEVFLLDGRRTPFGRYRGSLASERAVTLGARVLAALSARYPALGDVCDGTLLGVVLQGGLGQNPARAAAVRAGLPANRPASTLNSVCLGSLDAVCDAARRIRLCEGHCYAAGGFDSMSTAGVLSDEHRDGEKLAFADGLRCSLTGEMMGVIAEATNAAIGIGRADQDKWALCSQYRAAQRNSAAEVVDVPTAAGAIHADECVRPDMTADQLATLHPAFVPEGTITAGNAAQLADGAAAGIVGDITAADKLGVDPLVRIVDWSLVAGGDYTLHARPAEAIRSVLAKRSLSVQDVDLFEINEAFAGVIVACRRELDLPADVVNVNGGAIAIGHPLGATGMRLLASVAWELRRRQQRRAIAALCGGGGQGLAVLIERAD